MELPPPPAPRTLPAPPCVDDYVDRPRGTLIIPGCKHELPRRLPVIFSPCLRKFSWDPYAVIITDEDVERVKMWYKRTTVPSSTFSHLHAEIIQQQQRQQQQQQQRRRRRQQHQRGQQQQQQQWRQQQQQFPPQFQQQHQQVWQHAELNKGESYQHGLQTPGATGTSQWPMSDMKPHPSMNFPFR